jgi:hypothetical protein
MADPWLTNWNRAREGDGGGKLAAEERAQTMNLIVYQLKRAGYPIISAKCDRGAKFIERANRSHHGL